VLTCTIVQCIFWHDLKYIASGHTLTVHILYTKPMWEREKSSCVKHFLKHILRLRGANQLWYSSTNLMPYVHDRQVLHVSFLCVCKWDLNALSQEREWIPHWPRALGQLLTLMDGNKKSSKMLPHVVVVASTNRYGHATLLISKYHCCNNSGFVPCLRILLGHDLQSIHRYHGMPLCSINCAHFTNFS